VLAMPLAGWLSEKIGGYWTMALGLAIWGLATLLTGYAGGFAAILMFRLALGVGETSAFPCSSKLIAEHVPQHRLGIANGVMSLGLTLGPAFGVFFGGHLMAQYGWRQVFILFGAISLLWLIPWIAATWKASSEYRAERPTAEPDLPFMAILRRKDFWGLSLGHFAGNYGFYFVISWLPLYLVKARGFSMGEMANIGGFIYLAYAAAAAGGALLTDWWIGSGAAHGKARKTIATVSQTVGATGLMMTALGGPKLSLVGLFVTAVGLGLVSPHIFATAQRLAGRRGIGRWMGMQNALGNLSGIVGPLVTGAIIDSTGAYTWAFILTAVIVIVGLIGWLTMIPKVEPIDWTDSDEEYLSL
jgi:MFS family permease